MTDIRMGTLHGVSLGPGDPGLITRRAWALLERPDTVWTYPVRSLRKESYALDIALRAGLALPAQHQPLLFPMTHDAEKLARHWLKAAQTVRDLLATGRDVLFLVEGDASTYASFCYLARVLRELDADAQIDIVPGVTSFNAACARLQMPLSEQDDTIAIVPAAYGIAGWRKCWTTSTPWC
jgi:precorrin-2/cobalt-factor-2 C20-methyltransferase